MRIVYFTHSLVSCWNHGNAHFLRGVFRSLTALGHDVIAYEPEQSWSRDNLAVQSPGDPFARFAQEFPGLTARVLTGENALDAALENADLVIVHEWNEPALVAAIGAARRRSHFTLLFHDTHHRAVSDPDAIKTFNLTSYDGILAFGATLARVYEKWGWSNRVWVWHEAADILLFHPPATEIQRTGAVWVGNWGDGERTSELENFLLAPAQQAGVALDIHGVRYPDAALAMLTQYGARFRGWVPNTGVPPVFAAHRFTVHVPRRFYTHALPGIPTIRVFEALACGTPLICAPWNDCENLFRPGIDYLVAHDRTEMTHHMLRLNEDPAFAAQLAASGLQRILSHHTCHHRATELLSIAAQLAQAKAAA